MAKKTTKTTQASFDFFKTKIPAVKMWGVGRYGKMHVNAAFKYFNPTTQQFESAQDITKRIQHDGIEYRQIPNCPKYFVSKAGVVLSLNGITARILKPSYSTNTYTRKKDGAKVTVTVQKIQVRTNTGKNVKLSPCLVLADLWDVK